MRPPLGFTQSDQAVPVEDFHTHVSGGLRHVMTTSIVIVAIGEDYHV
ncbi:MAG: hypothetical protein NT163_02720 [Chlorobiales bacterium]|nr:hypothetical protein [Chlorobiales bacterium]